MASVNSHTRSDAETKPGKNDARGEKDNGLTDTSCVHWQKLQDEVSAMKHSLADIAKNLSTQHSDMAQEFGENIRHVYDDVLNDINTIRETVNSIGDKYTPESKYNSWQPTTPFRKGILRNGNGNVEQAKLKSCKSVDFVDAIDNNKDVEPIPKQSPKIASFRDSMGTQCVWKSSYSEHLDKSTVRESPKILRASFRASPGTGRSSDRDNLTMASSCSSSRQSRPSERLSRSSSNITSRVGTHSPVPGYGCCFSGDGKTIPYRSRRAWHSCDSSRQETTSDGVSGDDVTPMVGEVSEDWRVKVAPFLWDKWALPGLDMATVEKLKERLQKMTAIRNEIVEVHNEYRRNHGVPDVMLKPTLSRDAQDWSEKVASKGCAQYSNSSDRGENILIVQIEDELTGRQVVDTWYRERNLYNYTQARWQRGTCNFTQMIWRASISVGVGISKFPHSDTYVVVVQYQPPGNLNAPGQFRTNVQPPQPPVTRGEDSSRTGTPNTGRDSPASGRKRQTKYHESLAQSHEALTNGLDALTYYYKHPLVSDGISDKSRGTRVQDIRGTDSTDSAKEKCITKSTNTTNTQQARHDPFQNKTRVSARNNGPVDYEPHTNTYSGRPGSLSISERAKPTKVISESNNKIVDGSKQEHLIDEKGTETVEYVKMTVPVTNETTHDPIKGDHGNRRTLIRMPKQFTEPEPVKATRPSGLVWNPEDNFMKTVESPTTTRKKDIVDSMSANSQMWNPNANYMTTAQSPKIERQPLTFAQPTDKSPRLQRTPLKLEVPPKSPKEQRQPLKSEVPSKSLKVQREPLQSEAPHKSPKVQRQPLKFEVPNISKSPKVQRTPLKFEVPSIAKDAKVERNVEVPTAAKSPRLQRHSDKIDRQSDTNTTRNGSQPGTSKDAANEVKPRTYENGNTKTDSKPITYAISIYLGKPSGTDSTNNDESRVANVTNKESPDNRVKTKDNDAYREIPIAERISKATAVTSQHSPRGSTHTRASNNDKPKGGTGTINADLERDVPSTSLRPQNSTNKDISQHANEIHINDKPLVPPVSDERLDKMLEALGDGLSSKTEPKFHRTVEVNPVYCRNVTLLHDDDIDEEVSDSNSCDAILSDSDESIISDYHKESKRHPVIPVPQDTYHTGYYRRRSHASDVISDVISDDDESIVDDKDKDSTRHTLHMLLLNNRKASSKRF